MPNRDKPRLFTVQRYVYQRAHGRNFCHGTTRYYADGTKSRTLSTAYACAGCGDELIDGDQGYDTPQGFVHELCYAVTS